jgi:hypothetical protein
VTGYDEYVRGYADSCIGGRFVRRGLFARVLHYVRPGRTERAIARALGIHDGVQDRALRTLAEVEAEIERLLR